MKIFFLCFILSITASLMNWFEDSMDNMNQQKHSRSSLKAHEQNSDNSTEKSNLIEEQKSNSKKILHIGSFSF